MTTYRCVILGCGNRGRMHALAYKLIKRGELVACCDLDRERRDKFAQEFGITGYTDAVEMIQNEKPDLIHLVTGPSLRVELMTLVHEQGVPACIVEKPIATEAKVPMIPDSAPAIPRLSLLAATRTPLAVITTASNTINPEIRISVSWVIKVINHAAINA